MIWGGCKHDERKHLGIEISWRGRNVVQEWSKERSGYSLGLGGIGWRDM